MSNNKFKVLIVEDEANICSFIETLLDCSRFGQPGDRKRCHRFSGTRLSHQPQNFSLIHRKCNLFDNFLLFYIFFKVNGQIFHSQHHRPPPNRSRIPSPSIPTPKTSSTRNNPGKIAHQDPLAKYVWDSESIRPKLASGGCTPIPR